MLGGDSCGEPLSVHGKQTCIYVCVDALISVHTHCSSLLALAAAASESRREHMSTRPREYGGGGSEGNPLIARQYCNPAGKGLNLSDRVSKSRARGCSSLALFVEAAVLAQTVKRQFQYS